MAFCPYCGSMHESQTKFCENCGAGLQENAPAKTFSPEPPVQSTRSLHVGQLIWSILNLIVCCMPFGILSLVFVLKAKEAPNDDIASGHLDKASLFNIIGTAAFMLYIIVFIVLAASPA